MSLLGKDVDTAAQQLTATLRAIERTATVLSETVARVNLILAKLAAVLK